MIFAIAQLILVPNATTCGSLLFQAGVRFSTESAKFWPILSQNYALFGVVFAGLINMVAY